jgi:lipopolysaccharide biosynthesis glycosyltransferase
MSSCDENYARLIPTQIMSIGNSLSSVYDVRYYLFHSRVSEESLKRIALCYDSIGITFSQIRIDSTAPYQELSKSGGSDWSYEAYYSLECHRWLPAEVDRVLYIDAADVIIVGDIGEYYFGDFEGCSLIATCARFKTVEGERLTFSGEDIRNEQLRSGILRGTFNSGSYVINVEKFRLNKLAVSDFIALKDELAKLYPNTNDIYFCDQGLLSAFFAGDIKWFDYPRVKNLWYQPYNFCMWFFDRAKEICGGNPWYVPRIVHFAGAVKPWKFKDENAKELKPGQYPFYKIYELYENMARLTEETRA